jgi:hypothetical protein
MYEHKPDNMADEKKEQAKRVVAENGMCVFSIVVLGDGTIANNM